MSDRWYRTVQGCIALTAAAAVGFFGLAVALDRSPRSDLGAGGELLALAFVIAAVLAERFPLHLTDKTKVSVDTAVLVAAALVFDVPTAMVVAAVGVAAHQALLHDSWEQTVFNTAQTALAVGVGGAVYHALAGSSLPPRLPELGSAVAVLGCAVAMHAVNTLAVATVGAVQVGADPLRTWWRGLWLDFPEHVALVVLGAFTAVLAIDYPWALPIVAVPTGLVYVSLRRSVEMEAATRAAMEALADIVDLRDPATAGHSRRVAARTHQLAERLGLPARDAEVVTVAARVHDVGKAGLGAAGEPDPDASPRHPVAGARLIEQLPAYTLGARDVRHHHERWDGTGFPDGLAGETIPLGARLIAVADAFDGLSARAAREPRLAMRAAVQELRQGAGSRWDPRVVAAMAEIVEDELGRPAAPGVPGFERSVPAPGWAGDAPGPA